MDDNTELNATNAVNVLEVPQPAQTGSQPEDLRQRRILDYATESLAKLGPLEANLGLINSDLMGMAYRLKQAIEKAMEPAAKLEDFENILPAIENFQKLARQIDRFAQLELRVRNSQSADKNGKPATTAASS